jgi:hypothetical protein
MKKDTPQHQIQESLKTLRREFEAAADYARNNKAKLLRAWFTGENPAQDAITFASYARKIQEAQAHLAAPDEGGRERARTVLLDLKREFELVAAFNRRLPPPGLGAVVPSVRATDNPKATLFGTYAEKLETILKLMQ